MKRISILVLASFFAITICGCQPKNEGTLPSVAVVKTIEGLDLPECLVVDPVSGDIFVSNVVTDSEGYWDKDNNGFISRLSPDGQIKDLHWLTSSDAMPIHGPKGMCILNGKLYFNDIDTLKYCSLDNPSKVQTINISGAAQLNDLATDGQNIWTTDTAKGKIFCITPNGDVIEKCNLEAVNGVTCIGGKVFAVSWGLHEIFEIDPEGKKEPAAFGLADNFLALDCIEQLDDGSFIVSDWKANMLYSISADRKTITELMTIQSPADFALDRNKELLYIPATLNNRAYILNIK